MDVYDIEGVSFSYPSRAQYANHNISFSIKRGEIFGLLGANGAGKSTLIKQMVGLLSPNQGVIRLFGQPITRKNDYVAQNVSYMPQKGEALNTLTISEIIYFVAHLRGMTRHDAMAQRDTLIDRLDLGTVRNNVSQNVSGGQKRLTMVAIALAANYPMLILDEPTNDLDPKRRHQIWDLLLDIKRERGTTFLLVTHNVVEAERVIERVGIMRDSELVSVGRVGELKQSLAKQLQLDVKFKQGRNLEFLEHLPHYLVSEGHCKLLIAYKDASRVVQQLIDNDVIEDFALTTPTLEDLYIKTMES